MQVTKSDKTINQTLVGSILDKVKDFKEFDINLISLEELFKILNQEEREFVEEFLLIEPSLFGISVEYIGNVEYDRGTFVVISGQSYKDGEETKVIPNRFLPLKVFQQLEKLLDAMKSEIGKTLLVQSAFRSNASQLIVFLYFLRRNNFDLEKTAKRVAFPGYSEHGDPINPAIDFLDPDNREMVTTEQYAWLLNNASKYGFYLSYPESNNFGIQFEPWHWRYKEE